MSTLLVIDDEPLTRDCFALLFPKGQVRVLTAGTAAEGVALFDRDRPDVVALDLRLPDASGLDTFRRLREIDPKVPVVLVTGYGTAEAAIEAMRRGAFDYVPKPLDPAPLRDLLGRAFEVGRLMRVPAKVPGPQDDAGGAEILVGSSPPMQEVYKAIGRVAPQDVTVLVRGESGTGKELVARATYHYSRRADKPFLAVNCAAIPESLLESELFGHEKGAFTGADRRRVGKFEQAHGGTLFLDEIGDMTPLTQAKVLRVLQEQTFERVGGNEPVRTNVRVIAATNRDLEQMAADGRFRRDLYYRLIVFEIAVPPLRERGGDLGLLVDHLVRRFSRELGKDVHDVPQETLATLRRYPWPGNVRELQNVLKQALVTAAGPSLRPEFLPAIVREPDAVPAPPGPDPTGLAGFVRERLAVGATDMYAEVIGRVERVLFLEALAHAGYNLSRAARTLGISRTTLRAKMAALGIALDRTTVIESPAGDGP
jgi:two-component system nitrogen regulation response regulator GlnG